jgi:hypothetical protein
MSAAQQAAPESMDKAAPLGATMEASVPAPPGYAEEAYAPIGTSTGVAPVGSTGAIPALTTVDGALNDSVTCRCSDGRDWLHQIA